MFIRVVSNLTCLLALIVSCQAVAGMEPDTASEPSSKSTQDNSATESAADASETNTKASQAEKTNNSEQKTSNYRPGSGYIHSLLIDKTLPTLGGKWGADIFVDLPLNGEPDGAAITLRRAKLKYGRALGNNWQLKLSASYYMHSGLEIDDSYFAYNGWRRARLTIGVNDAPFSLESISSSAGLTFMERALSVVALSEQKGGGVTFLRRTPKSILNGALVLVSPTQDNKREPGQALVLHYVYSPVELAGRNNIHLGGSFSYRLNADENNSRFHSRPEIATSDTSFVDTGNISGAEKIIRGGLEASRVNGRFSWQTELLTTQVQRNNSDSVYLWGAYAYVSWFLTDDARNYNFGVGEYDALVPKSSVFKGGRGALELAFRASYVDLTDMDVIGGQESNLTLVFNWYLNDKLRIMANAVKVLNVNRPGSEYDDENPLIFALRFQWVML